MKKNNFKIQLQNMLKSQIISRGIKDKKVLKAISEIPRHYFVLEEYLDEAYADKPLPIGYNQTISQPYIVALMTELLELNENDKVLEIGTGSGYQTAILAKIAKEVYTIDRIPELVEFAKKNIAKLKLKNINFKIGDGTLGWKEFAPFDKIIVTAASPSIPNTLVNQLNNNGIMVIPVGPRYSQTLKVIRKMNNKLNEENSIECIFVPLIGKEAWKEEK
jgi:protein-L-isoaspartate(D-aspartate) O-methyltransferase